MEIKSQAAILYKQNRLLKIEEIIIPELKQGQVLVKIAYSGVCHSQLNEIRGLKGEDRFLPHVLGHEGSGIVEAVGGGVKKVKAGDHVVLTWIKGIGAEVPFTLYKKSDGLVVNSGAIATFLTKAVISENRLVKIPDKMPLREAALLGCAIPTGAGIILNTAKILVDATVAIFGMGGVGLSALLAAKLKGAAKIIAIDVFAHKLEYARRLGATHTINAQKQDVLLEIMNVTDRRGVDYAIESAGKRNSMEIAFQSVRDNGGLCILAGNLPSGERISLDPFNLIKGKRIVGTWGGESQPDRDIPEYANLYLNKKLKIDLLVANEHQLEDINSAFAELAEKDVAGRVLIKMLKGEGGG